MLLKHLRSLLVKDSKQPQANSFVMDSGMPVWVARQPVFTADAKIWGYELLSRVCPENICRPSADAVVATSSVIFDGYEMVAPALKLHERVLINYSAEMLLDDVPTMLPADVCAVEVLEDVSPSPEIIHALSTLKAAGYFIALDDYVGQQSAQPLLHLADLVKVDVLGRSPEEIARDVSLIKEHGCTTLAEKVEDQAMFELCKKLGFDLFQGFFFCKPQLLEKQKLTSSESIKTRLLARLAAKDYNMTDIAEIIQVDAALTTRLLRHLNSAYYALPSRVSSVQQAATMLGQRKLHQWLCVALLSEMDSFPLSRHVAMLAAQRGKFLELVCRRGRCSLPPSELFMLGLFSLLAVLLSVPVSVMTENLPLDADLLNALQRSDSPLLPWLLFAEAYERGNWQVVAALAKQLGINGEELSENYSEALVWVKEVFAE
ncbi:EAL and HDOD domain-containing protein [Oleidesulfovibrio sp.]|uniref:EAL and HDOD domain-containing protein n=1 Tax=Oleidesulfovibrio sp. TaxID=2909707 RepID=UPI003A84636E